MKTAILLAALALAGCIGTIPATFLKNDSGQVVRCGGVSMNYLNEGLPGYNMAKSDADHCVSDYEAHGYRVETDQPKTQPPVGAVSKPTANLAVCASLSTPEVRQKCVDKVEGRL